MTGVFDIIYLALRDVAWQMNSAVVQNTIYSYNYLNRVSLKLFTWSRLFARLTTDPAARLVCNSPSVSA